MQPASAVKEARETGLFFRLVQMAAIVTTMLLFPAGALIALVLSLAFGISPHEFVTFGGTFNEPLGVIAWWLVAFVPASIYSWFVRPD